MKNNYLVDKWARYVLPHLVKLNQTGFGKRLQRPYFIIGCGRSGTTMLQHLLETHPALACFPGEANNLWHEGFYPWHKGKATTGPIWQDPRTFTEASLAQRTDTQFKRLRAIFGAFQASRNAPVFVNKTVMINFMLPLVVKAFPEAKFVHLVRNGSAVALSYPQKDSPNIQGQARYREAGIDYDLHDLAEQYARYWSETVEEIDRQRDALGLETQGRFLEIRYEHLCSNPQSELARVGSFMDIDIGLLDARRIAAIESKDFKFKETFTPEFQEKLSGIARRGLELKGYLA